jgi:hypothetical protein
MGSIRRNYIARKRRSSVPAIRLPPAEFSKSTDHDFGHRAHLSQRISVASTEKVSNKKSSAPLTKVTGNSRIEFAVSNTMRLDSGKLMRRILTIFALVLALACVRVSASCEEKPLAVSACELKNDPAAYNHKLVEVTAFVSHGFEDFALFDPSCPEWPDVWLEYGGTMSSGTMYCCGVTAARSRPTELTVESIPIPLITNEPLKTFDGLIHRPGRNGALVHATLVGRFFAGRLTKYPTTSVWNGYGHMGCCTLLAIQEVKSVGAQDRQDLDYGASADQPETDKVGCGYRDLMPIQPATELLTAQRQADAGSSDWAFSDPQRVASAVLAGLANVPEKSVTLKQSRVAQGHIVYSWKASRKADYMVVVSRPYWLSFYSHDPHRVAWVVVAAYRSSCDQKNSVTRLE